MGFEVYRRTEADDLHRRNARLGLLADGARQLLSADDPDRIVQDLCERVMAHMDCQVFSCSVQEPGKSCLRLKAHAGMPGQALEAIGCPFPDILPSDCTHRPGCQRATIRGSQGAAPGEDPLPGFGIQAYACHPLVYHGRNIGILSFGTRNRPRFDDADLDLMRAVADLVAAAIARKRWEAELEQRVAERTAELAAANRELEGFTYAASHDMRAPLGRICSFSALLNKSYGHVLTGDGLMFLDFIQQNAIRLNTLVEDLLSHAQLGRHPLPTQPLAPRATLQAVLHERAEDISQRGAEIRVDLPDGLQVRGNHLGLSQVLRNLLDNALKYTREATPPVIDIGGRVQGDRCHLWVKDNGIGLDMAYKDRIFEIFRRLHTYSEYPGSGIGLALVKRAVERMDGRVWVESAAGRGATFFVDLPLAEVEENTG